MVVDVGEWWGECEGVREWVGAAEGQLVDVRPLAGSVDIVEEQRSGVQVCETLSNLYTVLGGMNIGTGDWE